MFQFQELRNKKNKKLQGTERTRRTKLSLCFHSSEVFNEPRGWRGEGGRCPFVRVPLLILIELIRGGD